MKTAIATTTSTPTSPITTEEVRSLVRNTFVVVSVVGLSAVLPLPVALLVAVSVEEGLGKGELEGEGGGVDTGERKVEEVNRN